LRLLLKIVNVEESFKFLIEQINENIGDFTPTQTSTQLNSKNKSSRFKSSSFFTPVTVIFPVLKI